MRIGRSKPTLYFTREERDMLVNFYRLFTTNAESFSVECVLDDLCYWSATEKENGTEIETEDYIIQLEKEK